MVERAPGKVNLCLFLGPTRADGRHELVTVFESVSVFDELTLTLADEDEVVCPGVSGPNLVKDALRLLREHGWEGPPIRIEIDKQIPIAAGMAGGSADAAAALRLAASVAPVPEQMAVEIAAALGSDVPSQLEPGVALGTGAGDVVERLPALAPHAFAIVPLPHALSTPSVYAEADRLGLGRTAQQLRTLRDRWREQLGVNDLEPASRSLCPPIEEALAALRDAGAEQVFVCGSGPTCAGVWWAADASEHADAAVSSLAPKFPRATAVVPVSGIGHNSPFG